jgi:hypothetical protein
MQFLFVSPDEPHEYEGTGGIYPEAPEKCPHRDCGMPVRMRKHGYYRRYIFTNTFKGLVRVRRYKCPVCGKTVSMLPAFCLPSFQYGVEVIWGVLRDLANGISVSRILKELSDRFETLTRRHLTYYRSRFRENRKLFLYGLNQMSPEFGVLRRISGDDYRKKDIPEEIGAVNVCKFNAGFHKETGKSFMSLQHIIA